MAAVTDVVLPTSPDEAVAAFADGSSVTVVGGGTIVMPEISAGRLRPTRALLLARAGLAGVSQDGSRVTIGAMATIEDLVGLGAPLGPCAANVADIEIRSQATVGGNLCCGHGEVPRGDLQGPLIAVDATVTSAGADGTRTQLLTDFLPSREGRLVLEVAYEQPAAGAFVPLDRPHAHEYTTLAVSSARFGDGSIRLAVTGVASHGVRLPSAEAIAGDPEAAGKAALGDVELQDDALASAWYRERALPVLVRRALAELEESR